MLDLSCRVHQFCSLSEPHPEPQVTEQNIPRLLLTVKIDYYLQYTDERGLGEVLGQPCGAVSSILQPQDLGLNRRGAQAAITQTTALTCSSPEQRMATPQLCS